VKVDTNKKRDLARATDRNKLRRGVRGEECQWKKPNFGGRGLSKTHSNGGEKRDCDPERLGEASPGEKKLGLKGKPKGGAPGRGVFNYEDTAMKIPDVHAKKSPETKKKGGVGVQRGSKEGQNCRK